MGVEAHQAEERVNTQALYGSMPHLAGDGCLHGWDRLSKGKGSGMAGDEIRDKIDRNGLSG